MHDEATGVASEAAKAEAAAGHCRPSRRCPHLLGCLRSSSLCRRHGDGGPSEAKVEAAAAASESAATAKDADDVSCDDKDAGCTDEAAASQVAAAAAATNASHFHSCEH